jgi:hypothetical protein
VSDAAVTVGEARDGLGGETLRCNNREGKEGGREGGDTGRGRECGGHEGRESEGRRSGGGERLNRETPRKRTNYTYTRVRSFSLAFPLVSDNFFPPLPPSLPHLAHEFQLCLPFSLQSLDLSPATPCVPYS